MIEVTRELQINGAGSKAVIPSKSNVFKPILVSTDFSATSYAALQTAQDRCNSGGLDQKWRFQIKPNHTRGREDPR
jgi:hypothetical protein